MPARLAHHIQFDGDWTDTERRVVESAIVDAETNLHPGSGGANAPWLCYCERLSGMSLYLAHRAGWPLVLHAYGATELGLKILLFGEELPESARGYSA